MSQGLNATVTSLLITLELIARDHAMIQDFFSGRESDQTAQAHKYPLLYADFDSATIYQQYTTIRFKIAVIDLLQPDNSNEFQIISDSLTVLKEIMIWLNTYYDLAVQYGVQASPSVEYTNANCAGAYLTLSIDVPDDYTFCTIPQKVA